MYSDSTSVCEMHFATLTSCRVASFESAQDYYPFGMLMPSRTFVATNSSAYRFGYQKQEIDKELWGGALSFNYRVEDSRLGRFFSVDLKASKYPYLSPFTFSANRVIDGIEYEGLEVVLLHGDLRGAFGATVSISSGAMFDEEGVAGYITPSLGVGFIVSLSGGGGMSFYPKGKIENISGWGASMGEAALLGIGEEATRNWSFGENSTNKGWTLSFGGGVGGGIFGEGTYTFTTKKLDYITIANFINESLPTGLKILPKDVFNSFKNTALKRIDNEIASNQKEILSLHKTAEYFKKMASETMKNKSLDYWTKSEVAGKWISKADSQNNLIKEKQAEIKQLIIEKKEVQNMNYDN